QRPEIADRLHHHQRRRVAPWVGAQRAGVARIDIAAGRAGADALLGDLHRLGERPEQLLALADEMQRRAARRARPQTRQAGEKLNQPLDLGAGDLAGHQRARLSLAASWPGLSHGCPVRSEKPKPESNQALVRAKQVREYLASALVWLLAVHSLRLGEETVRKIRHRQGQKCESEQ